MKKWLENKVFSSNKKTMLFIGIALFFVLFIYQIVMLCFGTYFNSNSDDFVQYAPILTQYVNYFKEGKLSAYNFTNNLGASSFADIYYVPLDIFTLLTFLLSFIMNDIIAFSIVNLSKILFGVLVFAYFLQRKGFKNWLVVLLSFMYFAVGGSWVTVTYSTYFSLFFYLPLCLLVVDLFSKGKKWLLPLYSFALVFYNFYNAYTLFLFMLLIYMVVSIRDNYSNLKTLFKDVVFFGLHIVLGVVMGLVILIPSVLYILNYTTRDSMEFEFVFELEVYFKMLYKLFAYETGTSMFALNGDYVHQHFSYYIGVMGLLVVGIMFFLKDKVSKIYKWSMLGIFIMMLIPAFSMIFSGVMVAYTRWFSFLNIILLYFMGHVLNSINIKELDRKKVSKVFLVIIGLYFMTVLFNIILIILSRNSNYVDYHNSVQQLLILILFGLFAGLYALFYFVKQKELMYGVFVVEMLVSIIMNFSVSFDGEKLETIKMYEEVEDVLDRLELSENSLERVYFDNEFKYLYNSSRITSSLVNENSFHSFFTKYIYDYKELYTDDDKRLYTYDLNRFNPNNSRVMNYKYVVLEKENIDYDLDYLDVYYEDEEYLVYINNDYEPFYVYESYYNEEEVVSLNKKNDLLSLEKKLFDGVVLKEGNYNLEKLQFNYDNYAEKVSFFNELNIVKAGKGVYESDLNDYIKLGYTGYIYFTSDEYKNIKDISLISNGEKNECIKHSNVYKCKFDSDISKVVINTINDISDLKFIVNVEIGDENYNLILIEQSNGERYLNYYLKDNSLVVLKQSNEKERVCLNGLCNIDGFEYDHILVNNSSELAYSSEEIFFTYYFDNLEYYNLNKSDNVASNKSLTYNKSDINISYTRDSDTKNDQVIVLPVTYSEEWIIDENDNYEIVRVNGGYLGILVRQGVKEIDITLTFKPEGVKLGLIGSVVGFAIYGSYIGFICYKRKKENKDGNI